MGGGPKNTTLNIVCYIFGVPGVLGRVNEMEMIEIQNPTRDVQTHRKDIRR